MKNSMRIAVVGGGPSGSFFAMEAMSKAKELGIDIHVTIIEKKDDLHFHSPEDVYVCKGGCNYCAGGISPKLSQILLEKKITLPDDLLVNKVNSIIVHGHWKNVELRVPESKHVYTVFRGSRPRTRSEEYYNFDSFILQKAREFGTDLIEGEVNGIERSLATNTVWLNIHKVGQERERKIEADFVVFAGGVNNALVKDFQLNPGLNLIKKIIPEYSPPKVRRALICELEIDKALQKYIENEIHFVEYGSKDVQIEMSSFVPKGDFVTIVLVGRSIDNARPAERLDIVQKYLDLPHIKRIVLPGTTQKPVCVCNPYMTVSGAKNVFNSTAAVIGDLAVARLYKDGIYSAYLTASALATALLQKGERNKNLKKFYFSKVRKLVQDNRYGDLVFVYNRIIFSNPILSRILYQAVLTERKTKPKRKRRLEKVLWQVASGDGTYKKSFLTTFHPIVIYSIIVGGFVVTMRNLVTENFFGLKWQNFERYPTGLFKEEFEEKKSQLLNIIGKEDLHSADFDSMYSIKIKAHKKKILECLGTFGSNEMQYFRPRMIRVRRIIGHGNEIGAIIKYNTPFGLFDFSMELVKIIDDKYLVYDVLDGFGKGGILIFCIDELKPQVFDLYIYVALNFQRGTKIWDKIYWQLFRFLFPGYVHDVLWNHSMCKLKDLVENPSFGY